MPDCGKAKVVHMAVTFALTTESAERYDKDQAQWESYLKRSDSNARYMCEFCGRFVKGANMQTVRPAPEVVELQYTCSLCGPCRVSIN